MKDQEHVPDLEAICVFAATGFFLDQDTYWKDLKVLKPATENELTDAGELISSKPYFEWYYEPRDISFDQAVEEFTALFEGIIDEQIRDCQAILPLSGGLDSRSQAVALKHLGKPTLSYSYSFEGGYNESGIGKQIADVCDFPFYEYSIPRSYLWNNIDRLASINSCMSEFTHPRQMAVLDELSHFDGVFSLGHWGDVLFDRGIPASMEQLPLLSLMMKKLLKKSGLELAKSLWREWGLAGSFEEYLENRLAELIDDLQIDHKGARTRAMKSLYWAPRWTSVNLSIFAKANPITLPYYDNRMCEFICTVPEEYLADRKIQIEYIKRRNPKVAAITWQDHKPYNLFTYHKNKSPRNIPYRAIQKLKREWNELGGKKYIRRNWELQFLGKDNQQELESRLFYPDYNQWISKSLKENFLTKFIDGDKVHYSHSVSTLLTIGQWYKQQAR